MADPFMMLLPPTEQFSNNYVFATPDDGRIKKEFDNFVNIVVQTDKIDGEYEASATITTATMMTTIETTNH